MIYLFEKQVNVEKLKGELSLLPVVSLSLVGNALSVETSRELTAEEISSLGSVVNSHTTSNPISTIKNSIQRAMDFGANLIAEFAAENVLLGITQAGVTGTVLNKLQNLMVSLQAGSLYEAIARIRAIPESDYDATFITEARLLIFLNKIEAYLGLSLSTEL